MGLMHQGPQSLRTRTEEQRQERAAFWALPVEEQIRALEEDNAETWDERTRGAVF